MSLQSRPTRPIQPYPNSTNQPRPETDVSSRTEDDNHYVDSDFSNSLPEHREIRARTTINTKLAGTTFATVGQKALKMMQDLGSTAFIGSSPRFHLIMKTEWDNAFDPDAIAVFLGEIGTGQEVRLGYLPNKERVCTVCGTTFPPTTYASDQVANCTKCNSPVARGGVASTVSRKVRERQVPIESLFRIEIAWDAGGITGNANTNKGCNVRVQMLPD